MLTESPKRLFTSKAPTFMAYAFAGTNRWFGLSMSISGEEIRILREQTPKVGAAGVYIPDFESLPNR
jgi:hypothetical protein